MPASRTQRFCLALLLAVISPTLHAQTSQPTPATQPNWLAMTVGTDTTLLTGPLRADGTVDYVAALNQVYGKGITPENNAFVALLSVIGGNEKTLGSLYAKILELAGAKKSEGTFFPLQAPHRLTLKQADEYLTVCSKLQYQPWVVADHPDLDRLVDLDKPALDTVHQAVQRNRFWIPLVSHDDSLLGVWGKPFSRISDITTILRIRAMRSLGTGDSLAAWQDLFDAHRVAHLIAQDSGVITLLVATRVDRETFSGDWSLIANPHSDSTLLTTISTDLEHLSPLPSFATVLRREQLYYFPDSIRSLAQQLKNTFEQSPLADVPANTADKSLKTASLVLPDWDHMLRYGNPIYAQLLSEHTWNSAAERSRYVKDFNSRIDAMHAEASGGSEDNTKALLPRPDESQAAYSERLARLLISTLVPNVDDRLITSACKTLEFTLLACAIERYRLDRGIYPQSPSDLVPKYLAILPQDFYNRPLNYSHDDSGFKIYSPGPTTDDPQIANKRGVSITIEIHR